MLWSRARVGNASSSGQMLCASEIGRCKELLSDDVVVSESGRRQEQWMAKLVAS